jgi:hypothetical protein
MTTCGQVAFAGGCANNAVLVHLNRVVARKTPDLLMFGISPITQTRNVCTSPRLRKQGMCVLLLNYANDEAKKVPYKQQNGRLSPAALQVRDADEGLLGIL